jgi:ankyrin repeat protein
MLSRFRWVFCQLEALRHCFPSNLRQFLNKLPDSLDETYEQMLRGINKAQTDDAYRLLQCLTVAVRPLHVEELAELLAFDFQASSSKGIPTLKEDWRWDDEEEAVLSICSSLITIVRNGDSRVVQFSHFSVKEYLTSPRLARSPHGDVSQFHIDLESAHTIMAQACLGTLLRPDERAEDGRAKGSPLIQYAAQHWVEHARFGNVSSRVWDGMDSLFDVSKPHFAAWLQVHDMDQSWTFFSTPREHHGSPLYYAAFCGLYDFAERLIAKHPNQVNARGGHILAPLPAALYKGHFRLANLLHKHGAHVDCRGESGRTPLHSASIVGRVNIMRWLLDHGADVHARNHYGSTPLHDAADYTQIEGVQVLLGHNAATNPQDNGGYTSLYLTIYFTREEAQETLNIARQLLEHGADPNICNNRSSTSFLHRASSRGWLNVARLLLSYGAKVDVKDREGRTPFQIAASEGHHEITKLLLEHGAVPPP